MRTRHSPQLSGARHAATPPCGKRQHTNTQGRAGGKSEGLALSETRALENVSATAHGRGVAMASARTRSPSRPRVRRERVATNPWNEVNAFVDSDGRLASALWRHLLGLVYVRTAGNAYELSKLKELAAHWRALSEGQGAVDVPMFALNAEPIGKRLAHWQPGVAVDLEQPPYSLERI